MIESSAAEPRQRAPRAFFDGIATLFRGFAAWGTSPRAMLLGLIPGAITFALFATGFVFLFTQLGTLTGWLTGFAEGWHTGWRIALQVAAGVGIVGAAALIAIYTFTAVTLAIGGPFFDAVSRRIDEARGPVPEASSSTSAFRGAVETVGFVVLTGAVGVALFFVGLIPLVGTVIAGTLGALTGSWFLALELTAAPLERRGYGLGQRWRILARSKARTFGFGLAVFVVFLIPLGALVMMPVAVAGGTLLARANLGESTQVPAAGTPHP